MSVFISHLYITVAISTRTCECTDHANVRPQQAWLISRAYSTMWNCLLQNTFYPLPTAMEGLSQTTMERKEHLNWISPKKFFPTMWKPSAQANGWALPASCSKKTATVSLKKAAMTLLISEIFYCFTSIHSTSYSLGCQGFSSLSFKHPVTHHLRRTMEEEVQKSLLWKVGPGLCKWVEMSSRNRWF